MIVETKIQACRPCESQHIVKNGKNACVEMVELNSNVAYTEKEKDIIINMY